MGRFGYVSGLEGRTGTSASLEASLDSAPPRGADDRKRGDAL